MPTLPDVSTQPAFFASQAIIDAGQIVGYSPEWHVYHRDSLQSVATAASQTEASELAEAAVHELARMRADAPPREPDPLATEAPNEPLIHAALNHLEEVESPPKWRHRYSIRANPGAKVGEMGTLSFRLPLNVRDAFVLRVAQLKELGDPGIETPTDALQDAIVCWLLMEGVI